MILFVKYPFHFVMRKYTKGLDLVLQMDDYGVGEKYTCVAIKIVQKYILEQVYMKFSKIVPLPNEECKKKIAFSKNISCSGKAKSKEGKKTKETVTIEGRLLVIKSRLTMLIPGEAKRISESRRSTSATKVSETSNKGGKENHKVYGREHRNSSDIFC